MLIGRMRFLGGQKVTNPCNNCKTRWLCKPYGGMCWRKKLFIRKTINVLKKAAYVKIKEINDYANNMLEDIEKRLD